MEDDNDSFVITVLIVVQVVITLHSQLGTYLNAIANMGVSFFLTVDVGEKQYTRNL